MFAKWEATDDKRSIDIRVGSDGKIKFYIGYNGGASSELIYNVGSLVAGRWYHFGFTFDDSDKSWKVQCYDDTAEIRIHNANGNSTNNISVEDASVGIGATFSAGPAAPMDGEMDEVVVFKDILSVDEIVEIRQGIYGS